MKNTLIILIALSLVANSFKLNAQAIDKGDVSDKYFVEKQENKSSHNRKVYAIINKQTKDTLAEVTVNDYDVELSCCSIRSHDYNFDGKMDFAIGDNRGGCYGGLSRQIYLSTNSGFAHSEEFTRLDTDECGIYRIDYNKKQFTTSTRSGCCWHYYYTYEVKNNYPVLVKSVSEGWPAHGMWYESTTEEKTITTTHSLTLEDSLLWEQESIIHSFEFPDGKKMRLTNISPTDTDKLCYFFADKNNKIELWYDGTFHYSKENNTLQFENEQVTYTITSGGIAITTPNKKHYLKAAPTTLKGSLKDILNNHLKNVVTK